MHRLGSHRQAIAQFVHELLLVDFQSKQLVRPMYALEDETVDRSRFRRKASSAKKHLLHQLHIVHQQRSQYHQSMVYFSWP